MGLLSHAGYATAYVGKWHLGASGYPATFNIEADPREENNVIATAGWVTAQYMRLIGEYLKTLEKYPNPKAVNLTEFGK